MRNNRWTLRIAVAMAPVLLAFLAGCSAVTQITEIPGAIPLAAVTGGPLPDPGQRLYREASRQSDDEQKLAGFIEAARRSIRGAVASDEAQREVYNAACAEIACIVHRLKREDRPVSLEVRDIDGRHFFKQEKVIPTARVRVKNGFENVALDGIGGSLAAYSDRKSEVHAANPNIASEGRGIPLTSLVTFPSADKVVVEIRDPARQDDVVLNGINIKLARDFTTALSYMGVRAPGRKEPFRAMIHPEENEWIRGLFFLEPFDPDQIPVVFIHGLQSSPEIWKDAYINIVRDEMIRENCQFWYYRYPTGYGVGHNAAEFRSAFREAMNRLDPGGKNPALHQAVLVGHSMGGLLASASIRSSGDRVWNQVSTRGLDEMDLDSETRNRLEEIAFFEPLPQVTRAVFLAAPHRGSRLAAGLPGLLATSMIRIPGQVINANSVGDALHGLTSLGMETVTTSLTSIDYLKPHAWQLETLLELPVADRVTMHSIIGKKGNSPLERSSDGVVPYWSSHIKGVNSELVVKSGHNVPENQQALAELHRILQLHLSESGR